MNAASVARSNPFSTRSVRPGAIAYRFPEGESAASVVDRLRAAGWRGAIVGAHGTGKSTLLAALLPEVARMGHEPLAFALHDRQRQLPREAWLAISARRQGPTTLVVIDGYEQLSLWQRFRLRRRCARRGHGLLATAHGPVGLPILFRTSVTVETAQAIVDGLAPPGPTRLVTRAEVQARLTARGGDFREALFDLYDLHEHRRAGGIAQRRGW